MWPGQKAEIMSVGPKAEIMSVGPEADDDIGEAPKPILSYRPKWPK